MSRLAARDIAVQLSFACSASKLPPEEVINDFFSEEHIPTLDEDYDLSVLNSEDREYVKLLVGTTIENQSELDGYIERYANGWKLERISKTALAVMRCAICEMLYIKDVPVKVSANEAVEIAKGYDTPDTVAFINGVLGGFIRGENIVDE